jgi:hypothetical protein
MNFLRKLRQRLLTENRVSKYLLYAVGEIVLVVIGILIALQINNWNEAQKMAKKEKLFLVNLQQDLESDSVRLNAIRTTLWTAVQYKRIFEGHMKGTPTDRDSLNAHFIRQYNILVDFVPNSTTMDELTNSNGFDLILNPRLRRQIVNLYNQYDDLKLKIAIGQEKAQVVLRHVSQKVKNINLLTGAEIAALLEDPFYVNQTHMNYLATQMAAAEAAYQQCVETLALIRNDLRHD